MGKDDRLSFNPLLLTILSHLEKREILRCKMVNRRIRDVIEAHKRDLALRPMGYLTMETLNKRKHQGKMNVALVVLRFWSRDKYCDLLFTESSVIVKRNNMPPITKYFENKYKRIQYKYWWSEADDQVWRHLIQKSTAYEFDLRKKYRARMDLFHYPEYRTESLMEGLCSFLSLICSAFELVRFKINSQEFNEYDNAQTALFTDQQMTSVMDTVLKVTMSRGLTIYPWYPNLVNFYTQLGCKSFTLKAETNISSFLSKLHLDDMFIGIRIDDQALFDSLSPVYKILNDWKSGLFTLRAINFGVPLGVTLQFSNEEVLEAFRDLEYFSVKETPPTIGPSPVISFFIRRPKDNKIIGLKYSQGESFTIRECLNGDGEEPQLNDWSGFDFDTFYYWCQRRRSYIAKPVS